MPDKFELNNRPAIEKIPLFCMYLAFLAICLLVYFNSLSAGFLYDDKFFIVQNPYIKSLKFMPNLLKMDIFHFAPTASNYYRPLQMLSYSLDYFFWKLDPFGYHLGNILIHSLNSFLLFFLLRLLLKDKVLALLTAVFFCVHPIHIGVVGVVGGRSNILEMMFMLLSLIALGRFYLSKEKTSYAASLFLFILGIFSREGALILPFFMFLCAVYSGVDKKKIYLSLLPFFIICALYLFLRSQFMPSDKLSLMGAVSLKKAGLFFYLCHDYLKQLVLPYGLRARIVPRSAILIAAMIPVFLLYWLLIKMFFKRNKIIIFASFYYLIALLPLLNLSDNLPGFGPILSEPYVYIASAGFFMILAWALLQYCRRPLAWVCAVLIILFYGSLTFINNINYKDEFTFYSYLLKVDPGNNLARINLGNIYLERKQFDLARQEANIVLTREPGAWDAWLLLGNLNKEKGELGKALEFYDRALVFNPRSSQALNNIGLIYKTQGRMDKAKENFQKALQISPESIPAMQNLADCLIAEKLYPEALMLCDKILTLDPDSVSGRVKIGIIAASAGNFKEAELIFQEALRLAPDSIEVLKNMGVFYANSGDLDKAIFLWKEALKIKPDECQIKEDIERADSLKRANKIPE